MGDLYRTVFWAKSRHGNPSELHRLEFHLADAGAVMEALLRDPAIRRATARAAGLNEVDEATAARICVLATLHDIGKANISFQRKVWPGSEARQAGHNSDLMPLLNGNDPAGQERLIRAMTTLEEAQQHWDDQDGHVFCGLLLAALSHHGTPARLQNGRQTRREHWERDPSLGCPFEMIAEIDRLIRAWFPRAFEPTAPPLPGRPEFQHQVAGLITMADWIASDEQHFPYRSEPDDEYMATARRQAAQAVRPIGMTHLGRDEPTGDPQDAGTGVIRAATERERVGEALRHFEELLQSGQADSIYVALPDDRDPADTAARVNQFLERAPPGRRITAAVTTGHQDERQDDVGRLTRPAIVGSISQATRSELRSRYAHLRAACRARSLLVIEQPLATGARDRELIGRLLHEHSNSEDTP